MCLLHGVDDGIAVQWLNCAKVDHFNANTVVSLKELGGLKRAPDHLSVGGDCDISSLPFNLCFANGKHKVLVHDLRIDIELNTVHHLVLEENDGVIIANRCLEQTSGIFDVPWADNFESWNGAVPRCEALCVLSANTGTDTVNPAERNRASEITGRHVERLGC